MKKIIIASAIILCGLASFSQSAFPNTIPQDVDYDVRPTYKRSIKDLDLNNAKLISDVVAGYPANWVTDYTSVEIAVVSAGKKTKALSTNEVLSVEQKNMLSKVDIASEVVVSVKYKYKNPVSEAIENNYIHVELTVVPESEAEYIGGRKELMNYLKACQNKVTGMSLKQFMQQVKFTINENGEVTNARLVSEKSGDTKMDKELLKAITEMPKWKPATDAKGKRVKQDFEFRIGKGVGGC